MDARRGKKEKAKKKQKKQKKQQKKTFHFRFLNARMEFTCMQCNAKQEVNNLYCEISNVFVGDGNFLSICLTKLVIGMKSTVYLAFKSIAELKKLLLSFNAHYCVSCCFVCVFCFFFFHFVEVSAFYLSFHLSRQKHNNNNKEKIYEQKEEKRRKKKKTVGWEKHLESNENAAIHSFAAQTYGPHQTTRRFD